MARRSILLLAAALIAAVGTALIILYVQGIDARASAGQELVKVLTATDVIEPGESVGDAQANGKLEENEVLRDDMVEGALSSTTSIEDQVSIGTIYPGEQIISLKFGEPGSEEILTIPDDKLAISVELTDPARVAGFVNPGSEVAIFVSADPKLIKPDGSSQELPPYTRLLLPKVQVIGVGTTTVAAKTTTSEDGEQTVEQIPRTIITVAVDQEQAERIIFGSRNGDLSFALLSDKSQASDNPGVTAIDVIPEAFGEARMTVIIEPEPILAGAFKEALGAGVTVLPSAELLEQHLQRHPHEYAVVLGPSVSDETAATVARQNRIQRPTLGVIQVLPDVDQRVLTSALRSGMREVVEINDLGELNAAVLRCHGVARAMMETVEQMAGPAAVVQRQGSVITVFSTKGGVGKSTVATNLAVSFADAGRRVCIVDLDVLSGDVAIMLQVNPLHTLSDLSQISGSIDIGGVESLLSEHSPDLSILAAPVQLGSQVPADAIEGVLEILKGMFEVVVVDTSGSFDDYALTALDVSEVLVLVGTLDIPALKSLKLAAGTLDLLNVPRSRWHLVLNRADAKVGLSEREFADTLGVEIAASLPSSRDVLAAVNRGEALVRANPTHPISRTLAAFAASLIEDAPPPMNAADDHADNAPRRRAAARRGLRMRKVN